MKNRILSAAPARRGKLSRAPAARWRAILRVAGLALALAGPQAHGAVPAGDEPPVGNAAAGAGAPATAPDGAAPAATGPGPGPGPVPAAEGTVSVSAALPLPRSAHLVYRTHAEVPLLGFPVTMNARTDTTWKFDGQHYEAHLHIDQVHFDQASKGAAGPAGLVPERYDEKRPMHDPESVRMDWERHALEPVPGAPAVLAEGGQDRLSLQFQLAWLFAAVPDSFTTGAVVPVQLIGLHGVEPWTFTVEAPQPLRTGLGVSPAVRLHASRLAGGKEESLDFWVDAGVHGMPARFRIVDRNGAVIDSVLEEAGFE